MIHSSHLPNTFGKEGRQASVEDDFPYNFDFRFLLGLG
mgnify:CR=1 FL=1